MSEEPGIPHNCPPLLKAYFKIKPNTLGSSHVAHMCRHPALTSPDPQESEIMSLFVVEYTYSTETAAGREEHRPAHRDWLIDLVEKKIVVASGPFADKSGAYIVVVGPDMTTVEELFAQDPFARHDLLTNKRIVEWAQVVGPFSD